MGAGVLAWPWSTVPGNSTWDILNVPICLLRWAEPYTDQELQALLMAFGNMTIFCAPSAGASGLSSPDWGWPE